MWQQLDPDDVRNAVTQPELDLFNQGSSADGSPDRLSRILEEVVSLVRGKVAAFPENRVNMGEGDTIPEELYGPAIEIARYKLLTAFPEGKLFLDEGRTQCYRDALTFLNDAAKGLLHVELGSANKFIPDAVAFSTRDDDVANRLFFPSSNGEPNRNLIDFGFWH